MLSKAAFNALLKTLEEPPPRSLFLFATTNPESIPFTVVSRCQRYDLRRIAAAEILERLRLITEAEAVKVSDKSLLAIAREGDGSMRDAQTLLDQVIAYGGTQIDDEVVADVLDLIDRNLLLSILSACVEGDAPAALAACARAGASGIDAKRLGANLVQLLRDLVVLHVAPDADELIEAAAEEVAELRELAKHSEPARLRRMFRALVKEQEDLAWAPQPFAVLEMAVVRLATMPAGDDVAGLLARLDALEQQLRGSTGPVGGDDGPAGGAGKARRGKRATASRASGKASETISIAGAVPRDEAETPSPETDAGGDGRFVPEGTPPAVVFDHLRSFAGRENPGLLAPLDGGRISEQGPDHLCIAVPSPFSAKRLNHKRSQLEAACARFFGRAIRIEIQSSGSDDAVGAGGATPASDPETQRNLRQRALNHPAVRLSLESLGGEIVEIHPIGDGR
jgi:DNA polymerase-3 subunit gamma/tau